MLPFLRTTTSTLPPRVIPFAMLLMVMAWFALSMRAEAAATLAFVRFDRMHTSTASTGTICAKPGTAGTATKVVVGFPTGYTVSTTLTNWAVNTTNLSWPTGGTAWPGIGTATVATGQNVTFPSSTLTVGTLYCFNWTNGAAVSVKSAATASNIGTITTQTSTSTTIDSLSYATASVSNDQIVVSATVPPTFSFALSGNTDPLGSLTSSTIESSPTPLSATVSTNAKNGWMVWAKDLNTGLSSAASGDSIASTTPGTNSTLSAGSEGYNTGITSSQVGGAGTITVAAPFVGGVSGKGGGLDTTLRPLATSSGTADTAVLALTNNATISNITSAANDYTDTITVVGAGLF